MGTTVTVAFVDAPASQVVVRPCWRLAGVPAARRHLEQITTDHSLVAELVQSGVLTPEEAERHPQRSAITRAARDRAGDRRDVFTVAGRAGDLFLLCSDGLTDMLWRRRSPRRSSGPTRTRSGPQKHSSRPRTTQGGEDNITVVLFELVEGEPGSEPEPEPTAGRSPRRRSSRQPDAGGVAGVRRHGAGPGGRAAAIGFIALVVVVGLLALYWGISR